MLRRLEMNEVFDKFMFAQPRGGRYFVPEGWHPLLGLPGAIDTSRGAVLICKLQKPLKDEVQNRCLNGVIEKIRIHRSARTKAPDTMLVLASDLLREFEVCQVPMMSDTEVEGFIGAVYDRIGWQHLLAAQKQAIREGPKRNVGSEVDPIEEKPAGDNKKLAEYIATMPSQPPTNLEQWKALAAIMQDNLVKTTELREKQAHLIELLKSDTNPELLAVLTDLLVGPSPEEQSEQEAMHELMAKAYRNHQSKKDQSTS